MSFFCTKCKEKYFLESLTEAVCLLENDPDPKNKSSLLLKKKKKRRVSLLLVYLKQRHHDIVFHIPTHLTVA